MSFFLLLFCSFFLFFFFFFNDTATTEIYTLSLHDALPIRPARRWRHRRPWRACTDCRPDRKSTRLNSSHITISYAVFCLKKKKHDEKYGANRNKGKDKGKHTQAQINA